MSDDSDGWPKARVSKFEQWQKENDEKWKKKTAGWTERDYYYPNMPEENRRNMQKV